MTRLEDIDMTRKTYYHDGLPDEMLGYFQAGALPAEIPGKLSVRKEDVLNWLRDTRKPDFKEAFKLGMAASEAYWARMGLEALTGGLGKTFREKLYLYILESQFGWKKDGIDVEKVEREAVMSDAELDARIEQLLGSQTSNLIPLPTKVRGTDKKRKA